MTKRVQRNIFQQRVFKRLCLFRFGLERELVVHLGIGIHVAYVVVADQGHVTKFINSTNVVVSHVASRVSTQKKFFQI